MPRRPRVFVEGLIYHVYNRVGRGASPFKLEGEARAFWTLLHDVKQRDGLEIFAWCIMPTHYHLAVRTGTVPLWRSIRHLQHRYSVGFNRRSRVLGAVWQARYKARPVEDNDSLLRLLAYVHLNPAAAGMVADPVSYRWSGHRELVRRSAEPLVDVDSVLAMFGGTRRGALQAYLSLLGRTREEAWVAGPLETVPWWRAQPAPEAPRRALDALGASRGPARRRLSADEFLERSLPLLAATRAELAGAGRDAGVLDARELLAGVAVERWGVGVKALAGALGKSRDGVSHWVRRAARRRGADAAFAARLDALDEQLATRVRT